MFDFTDKERVFIVVIWKIQISTHAHQKGVRGQSQLILAISEFIEKELVNNLLI